jgi:NAD(P)-dependent dehydrogenase (short-subunit alcohol dehydrogenase family)
VGLGLQTAKYLAQHGAIVTIACRNEAAGKETVAAIKVEFPNAKVSFLKLDLGSLASVHAFTEAYKATGNPIHLLINNAGVMACPLSFTSDGLETQFGVNHIGHFLLTTELLEVIKRSGTAAAPSRIINVSSGAQGGFAFQEGGVEKIEDLTGYSFTCIGIYWGLTCSCGLSSGDKGYNPLARYCSSKFANVSFAQELQRRFDAAGDHVVAGSLHPGVIVDTSLSRHLDEATLKMALAMPLKQRTLSGGMCMSFFDYL